MTTHQTPVSRPTTIADSICDMIMEVATVKRSEITPSALLREDLALDSVASMELLSMIDEAFELELEMEDVLGIETVGGVIALTEARLARGDR